MPPRNAPSARAVTCAAEINGSIFLYGGFDVLSGQNLRFARGWVSRLFTDAFRKHAKRQSPNESTTFQLTCVNQPSRTRVC